MPVPVSTRREDGGAWLRDLLTRGDGHRGLSTTTKHLTAEDSEDAENGNWSRRCTPIVTRKTQPLAVSACIGVHRRLPLPLPAPLLRVSRQQIAQPRASILPWYRHGHRHTPPSLDAGSAYAETA